MKRQSHNNVLRQVGRRDMGQENHVLKSKSGTNRSARRNIVVAAVAILLIIAIPAFFVLLRESPSSPPPISGQSGPLTLTAPEGIETISPSGQTTITPQLSSFRSLIDNLNDVFGNYSRMTVNSQLNGTKTETVAYVVLGRPTINSSQYWQVSFALSKSVGSGKQNSSAQIWFDTTGSPAVASIEGVNYTGQQARTQSANFTTPIVLSVSYSGLFLKNQTILSQMHFLRQDNITLGPTLMTVVSYSGTFSPPVVISPGVGVLSGVFRIGTSSPPGGAPASIMTYFGWNTQQGVTFENVTSITTAPP
jgi:hypothetical protein